jgi:hypothetical protein
VRSYDKRRSRRAPQEADRSFGQGYSGSGSVPFHPKAVHRLLHFRSCSLMQDPYPQYPIEGDAPFLRSRSPSFFVPLPILLTLSALAQTLTSSFSCFHSTPPSLVVASSPWPTFSARPLQKNPSSHRPSSPLGRSPLLPEASGRSGLVQRAARGPARRCRPREVCSVWEGRRQAVGRGMLGAVSTRTGG